MSKDPAFLFYPADYIIGTMGMSFEEKGAYMELLMMQFSRGHMENEKIYDNEKKGDARGKVAFDTFWDLYDKKVDRAAAEPKWNKLNQKEQQDIMIFLPDIKENLHLEN